MGLYRIAEGGGWKVQLEMGKPHETGRSCSVQMEAWMLSWAAWVCKVRARTWVRTGPCEIIREPLRPAIAKILQPGPATAETHGNEQQLKRIHSIKFRSGSRVWMPKSSRPRLSKMTSNFGCWPPTHRKSASLMVSSWGKITPYFGKSWCIWIWDFSSAHYKDWDLWLVLSLLQVHTAGPTQL